MDTLPGHDSSPLWEWQSCPNTLWVGQDGILGYVSPAERHQESDLHEDGMYVLEYTSAGEQDVLVDRRWRLVPAQHLLWTGPHAWHAHRVAQPIESIYFIVTPAVVDEVWRQQGTRGQPPQLAVASACGALEATMQRALREARERQPGHPYLLSLLLRQALAECFRLLRRPGLELPAVEADRRPIAAPLQQAVEILNAEHDRLDLQLSEVAQRVGFSLFHFSRRFKEEMGITPGQYLRNERLAHAVPLLLRSDVTCEAIAYLSGFGAARRLTDACKHVFGHLPMEIRAAGSIHFVANDAPDISETPEQEYADA